MIAIISDIHANLEALQAVFEDINNKGIETIYCLGDIIGFGPNPRECIQMVKSRCIFSIAGDHEEGILVGYEKFFGYKAKIIVEWTRNEINSEKYNKKENDELWNFLKELPKIVCKDNLAFGHGSIKSCTECVTPTASSCELKLIFEQFAHICFCGHTHIPGIFTNDYQYHYAGHIDNLFQVYNKVFINVGSVGQPRDGNPQACYVIFDGQFVRWRRVTYNYKKTMKKIMAIDDLDDMLAHRLEHGR
ncbi:metallophosphoesterase [Candidatus Uabimicrobium sp. HlEnr_7]|uniref:metallophosphoesterase family protein n=1 Tax=Candidatus Uabimicrobium helgolandensis TaxID=3095367 RepID=UPI003556D75C